MTATTPSWWIFRGLEEHADEDTDHPLAPCAAGDSWGWRLIHAGGSGTRKTEAILNLVAGDLPRALRQHGDPKKAACWIRLDRVVLVSPDATEPKYNLLADVLVYGDPEVSSERFVLYAEELPTEFNARDHNLILDDLYTAPKSFRDRIMTQSYFDTDKGLRCNATHLALHPCGDDRALSEVTAAHDSPRRFRLHWDCSLLTG